VEELLIARQSAYDRLDALQLALGYTEDCRVESPIGGAHTGRDAVEQVFRAVFKAFPDHSVRTRAFVIDGNRVAQLLDLAGTDTGGFLGLPATGKPFRVPAVFLYEFRDRLIARERRIYDFTGLLVQVGVLKAKPATTGVTPPGTTSR
jgi:steroid delta-isomerase-like uncharacterized protein